jgi:dCTP deaminase
MEYGFLTDKEIKDKNRELFKKEYDESKAEGASYDMRLGDEVYISGEDCPRLLSEARPFVTIPRGQFALLLTKEYVTIPPDYFALISIKLSIKQDGLINISGFHVDPGFEGKLYFSVFNAGPRDILLKYGEPVFMIFFYKLKGKAEKPYSKDKDRMHQEHLPMALVTSLKGTSASLYDVDKKVSKLEVESRICFALIIALIAAIIAIAVAK